MQPLESLYLKSRAATKRAARGHAYLSEQFVGLRALAAARLVADGDGHSIFVLVELAWNNANNRTT